MDGPVATVTLDRPDKRNAQTPAMWRGLREIGRSLAGDVRVVVVRGAGPSFSAGLDRAMFAADGLLAEQARMDDEALQAQIAAFQQGFSWLRRPDIVSIAAVQGHAVGAGFQLALACDVRVAAEDVQLTMAETSLGLVPDLGGTQVLVEQVGYARALEICVTGRRVGASEARALGLVQLVVPLSELDGTVADLVAAVLVPPRDAVVETTALLQGARSRSYDDQLAAERQAQTRRLRDLAGAGE